jgi:hypothetical protein
MKNYSKSVAGFLLTIILSAHCMKIYSQSPMPEALMKGSVQEQVNAIYERTKVFENYRAIREDMFQKLIGNLADTAKTSTEKIRIQANNNKLLTHKADSLASELKTTKTSLDEAVTTKNSISLFGKEINKNAYNATMWIAMIGLAVVAAFLFLLFRRSLSITHQSEKALKELRDEFQEYRKSSREAREKMSMDHFNELKKLRGGR